MDPTVERFRALARSSPWRWSTLRYTQQHDPSGVGKGPVRIRIRRPKLARVERLDGTLLRVLREDPQTATPLSRSGDAAPVEVLGAPDAVVPDAEGLVRRRPERSYHDTDTAMVGTYYDVALLDPLELADGRNGRPGTTVEDLRLVDHHGRQAWEAVLRPTAQYYPRCSCCALLLSDIIEGAGVDLGSDDPTFTYPDAHRVRLDIVTGVCVANEALGGTRSGTGHDIHIEAVDELMGDELFPPPEPARWSRFLRRF